MKSNTPNKKSGMNLKHSHHSRAVFRKLPKSTAILSGVLAVFSVAVSLPSVLATETNTTFQVNVVDSLSVEITTPTSGATGNMNEFLRNKVSLNVTTNNANGFTASMTTKTASTSLVNTVQNTYTLPTLGSNDVLRSSFPANYWGYSFDDTEAGDQSSHYSALVGAGSTPITVLSSNTAASTSKDFYFGAKGNASLVSGTYTGVVVISVVTDVIDNTNPVTPTDPVKPTDDTPNDQIATYQGAPRDRTIYTTTSTDATAGTETTTTEITSGDNTASYTPPQGVTENVVSRISSGSDLATGLGITASVAAASGAFFFIIAGRDEGDEEEEEEKQIQ